MGSQKRCGHTQCRRGPGEDTGVLQLSRAMEVHSWVTVKLMEPSDPQDTGSGSSLDASTVWLRLTFHSALIIFDFHLLTID